MPVDVEKLVLVKYPDPCLRKICEDITVFDDELIAIAERMLDLMRAHHGVGLAGPQVGLLKRIFVCNPTPDETGNEMVIINPVIGETSGAVVAEEGCLSLPQVTVNVRRAQRCVLRAVDLTGKPFSKTIDDLPARICQHETDHLVGKLILDYQSPADQIANRRILKVLEEEYRKLGKTRRAR